jgi:hypothetical protein
MFMEPVTPLFRPSGKRDLGKRLRDLGGLVMRGFIVTATSLSLLVFGAQMVRADQVTTTTVEKTVTTPDSVLVPVEPDARTIIMMGSTPSDTSVSTVEVKEFGGNEHYAQRLAAMLDQIDNGMAKGMISPGQADSLRVRYNELADAEIRARENGFQKLETDQLEKDMNGFQIHISRVLTDGMQTAGAGLVQ